MEDFSAAAMIKLVALGLRRQGLAAPPLPQSDGARTALPGKRALVETLLARHGPIALLRMGEAIEDTPQEPALIALGLSRDPHELLERWRRLERFVHSRHRTELVEVAERSVVLRHKALSPHPDPRRAESLLVMGLLIALIERQGAKGVQASPVGVDALRLGEGRWCADGGLPDDVSTWRIGWGEFAGPSVAPIKAANENELIAAARRRLLDDPGRPWTVALLAQDLCASTRSLQRRLRALGLSFSALLLEARIASASDLLCKTDNSAAEIGFACGFCDQAHFTRRFKEQTALTPAVFRKEFAAA